MGNAIGLCVIQMQSTSDREASKIFFRLIAMRDRDLFGQYQLTEDGTEWR